MSARVLPFPSLPVTAIPALCSDGSDPMHWAFGCTLPNGHVGQHNHHRVHRCLGKCGAIVTSVDSVCLRCAREDEA
jgi:hypothetical protein